MVESLHRADLLLSPAVVSRIEQNALQHLLEAVRGVEPREFLVRQIRSTGAATPRDMYEAIIVFMQEYIHVHGEDHD